MLLRSFPSDSSPAWRRVASCRRGPKSKTRIYYAHRERRFVHSIGEVQIVFSTNQPPLPGELLKRDQVKILLSNDLRLATESIVALYALRWQIEIFFKELKSVLGMHHYRFRQFRRVEAWMEACLITYMYLEWIRGQRLQGTEVSERERKWWSWQRSYGLARAVQQRIEESEIVTVHRHLRSAYLIRKLRRLTRAALPPEYRYAA